MKILLLLILLSICSCGDYSKRSKVGHGWSVNSGSITLIESNGEFAFVEGGKTVLTISKGSPQIYFPENTSKYFISIQPGEVLVARKDADGVIDGRLEKNLIIHTYGQSDYKIYTKDN